MRTVLMWLIALTLLPCQANASKECCLTDIQKARIINHAWVEKIKTSELGKHQQNNTLRMKKSPEAQHQEKAYKILSHKITLKADAVLLSDLIQMVARSVHLNPVLSQNFKDKPLSIMVNELAVSNVLNIILYSQGYGFAIEDENLIIKDKETRIFQVLLPPLNQNFQDTTSNESFVDNGSSKLGNGQRGSSVNQEVRVGSKVVVQNSISHLSFWDDVAGNVKSLMTEQGQMSFNRSAGTVMVTDIPFVLESINTYFVNLNNKVTQQIEVDVKVVEVSLSHENRLGVDWSLLAKNLKALNSISWGSNFASSNFSNGNMFTFSANSRDTQGTVTKGGVALVIEALAKQGKVDVVSQPKMLMLNNQVSIIQVGSTQGYIDQSSIETTQSGGTITSISSSQVQEGVTLRLLGNIVGDEIFLSLTPVVTTIDGIRTIHSGNTTIEAPQTTTKSINSVVKLKEGFTVAIGGLITSSKQKRKEGVPFVSNIPVIGKLFAYTQEQHKRSELIIFITPKKV